MEGRRKRNRKEQVGRTKEEGGKCVEQRPAGGRLGHSSGVAMGERQANGQPSHHMYYPPLCTPHLYSPVHVYSPPPVHHICTPYRTHVLPTPCSPPVHYTCTSHPIYTACTPPCSPNPPVHHICTPHTPVNHTCTPIFTLPLHHVSTPYLHIMQPICIESHNFFFLLAIRKI